MNSALPSPAKIRVLVVEDEAIVARDICQQLSEQGYDPAASTGHGEKAIELAGSLRPDLVLMDVNLAGAIDGIAAARTIRDRFGLPVVFLTAFANRETLDRAKAADPFGYLIKPFAEQDLRTAIEMALYKHGAEARLRHSEARHAKMVANIGDVIVILDPTLITGYTSPNIERLFGWKPEDLAGGSIVNQVHPEDMDSTRKYFAALLEAPNANGTMECRYQSKDGSYRWIEFTGVNLLHDPDIKGVLGDFHDITVRRKAEARLRLLSNALDAAANAIVITNRDGKIEWANAAFTTITGYTAAEAIGRNPGDLLRSGKQPPSFFQAMWETILAGQVWHGEIINRRKDGRNYTEEMTITPMKVETGEISHFIAIKQDVTHRKSLEAQLVQAQKMEAVGLLAGGVAHDFNNILAVVLMYLGLLHDEPSLGPDTRNSLQQLDKEVRRGASLTRQLLTFSRQQAMEPTLLNLNSVVEGLVKMLYRLLGEQITIIHEQPERVMLTQADEGMLEQVVMNLCINARDAMPRGGQLKLAIESVVITAASPTTHADSRPGRFLCFAVADTGSGMDAPTLQRIFEPFFTTKESGKGTGLGLAIVHGIVKQHRGWIEVESTPRRGTTFRVYLPESIQPGRTSPSATPLAAIAPGRGETILLTEDEDGLRTALATVLKQHGYSVIEAQSGPQALELWHEHQGRIDLLFTDMVMPGGMDGQELVEQLLQQKPGLNIIVCTGYKNTDSADPFAGNPRITLLRKPFDMSSLLSRVRQALDRK